MLPRVLSFSFAHATSPRSRPVSDDTEQGSRASLLLEPRGPSSWFDVAIPLLRNRRPFPVAAPKDAEPLDYAVTIVSCTKLCPNDSPVHLVPYYCATFTVNVCGCTCTR
eukprot:2542488-Amphidinium_carterae.1